MKPRWAIAAATALFLWAARPLPGVAGAPPAPSAARAWSLAAEPTGSAPAWWESAAGVRFGLVPFAVREPRPEWNVGLGLRPARDDGRASFWGGGLSVIRTPVAEEGLAGSRLLEETEVTAWLGGCLSCDLSDAARLHFELRWSPKGAELWNLSPRDDESRFGVTFDFAW
ncbi:MAG: hypothetical protein Kow0092_19430 [Deferrisomatales bacterium]